MVVVRYADDLVVGFQNKADAVRFLNEFRERLAKFELEYLRLEKSELFGEVARGYQIGQACNKIIKFFRALVAMLAIANSNLARRRFPFTHDQHVGNFRHLRFADFEIHFFAAIVQFRAETGCFQLCVNLFGVFALLIGDGKDDGLHRRKPHRESASVVLNQNAEKAFD